MRAEPLERERLAGDPLDAARALVGAFLVRDSEEAPRRVGRIVEVEAYVGQEDAACHARFGRTARNSVMWGEPGVAYVYLVYGMYDCLNVVVAPPDRPAAVLIRAVEPIEGIDAMRAGRLAHAVARRRSWTADRVRAEAVRLGGLDGSRIASGPGAVSAAFSISRPDNGTDLCLGSSSLRLAADPGGAATPVVATPRIGIDYAAEPWRSIAWRFVDPSSPALSGPVGPRRRARSSSRAGD
ncbi:MAG TPA: DNA-3-methyladenine glycosylase [Candidatus Limnocylindrales bacterium]|nr:DNA-3-methyladenine glycosylase [Candidatus Limnocylindrales bacterium]